MSCDSPGRASVTRWAWSRRGRCAASTLTTLCRRGAARQPGRASPQVVCETRRAFAAAAQAWATVRPMSDMPAVAAPLPTWRVALAGAAVGSVLIGLPLTLLAASALSGVGHVGRVVVIWVVLVATSGLTAYRLRRR